MFMLINPMFTQRLVDDVLGKGMTELLVPTVVAMCAIVVLRSVINYSSVMLVESASLGVMFNLRMKIYKQLQRMDMRFYHDNKAGDILTIMTSDVDMVRHNLVFVFRQIVSSILLFLGAAIYYFSMNWKFAIAMIALTPFIFAVTYVYRKRILNVYKELRQRLSRLNSDAQENIEGNRVVKAFAREKHEIVKFNDKSGKFREQNLSAQILWLRFFPYIEGMSQSSAVTAIIVGGILMMRGDLTPGMYMAFTSLSWAVTAPFQSLGQLFNDLQRFFASTSKIISMLGEKPDVENSPDAVVQDEKLHGEIEFKSVGFAFGQNEVLRDVSFHANPGETIAIMGETGSGKTLIADLISRFYDATSGEIRIDGRPIRDWDLHTLRHSIGMTTQEVFLFSDTVDSNIAYGAPDIPETDVRAFADASAADFIERLPHGYDTIIGERGVGLSGGQKQRIALARAIAIRPSILILDDTTSAVDMETEKYIQEHLQKLDFQCTKFIIAQRISSVRNADQILLLENGTIAERGTHEELLKLRGRYYDLWKIQSGVDESTEELLSSLGVKF
jgi:ATP-binding cassette subfamily B protein